MQLAAGMMVTSSVRLVRPLGAGGMGSVWVAEHLSLRTEVVVKFMSAELAASEQAAARFAREAASAAQAKSPHVVQMHDHGITPDGVPYIVMEMLEGRDLGRHLAARGRLLPGEFAIILDQLAKALVRAHERGIVHRDIKPDNVFLCDTDGGDTFVKLLDFGIAKSADALHGNSTSTGAVVGTPYYMSPEQVIDAKAIDFRSDLWSLGVLAFKALTGELPFFADSFGALALAIHHGPIPKPSTLNAALPAAVDAWFLRACSRDSEERFASAREMADAFASTIDTPSNSAAREVAGAGAISTHATARRSRLPAVGALALLVLVGAAIGVNALRAEKHGIATLDVHADASPTKPREGRAPANAAAAAAYEAAIQSARDGRMGEEGEERHNLEAAIAADAGLAAAHLRLTIIHLMHKRLAPAREQRRKTAEHRGALGEVDASILEALDPLFREPPSELDYVQAMAKVAARYPGDAFSAWLEGLGWLVLDHPDQALAAFERSLAADSTWTPALWGKAAVVTSRGELEAALPSTNECLRIAPSNTECIWARVQLMEVLGRCEDMRADAKRGRAIDPKARGFVGKLAAAAFVLGDPMEMVGDLLAQSDALASPDERPLYECQDMMLIANARGDFQAAETQSKKCESLAAALDITMTNRSERPRPRLRIILDRLQIAEESGQLAAHRADIASTRAHVGAWSGVDDEQLILLSRFEAAAGLVTRDELRARRDTVARAHREAWRYSAIGIDSPEDAKTALAAYAAITVVPLSEQRDVEHNFLLGRLYFLAGRYEDAREPLRIVTSACDGLHDLFMWIPALAYFGEALERTGDTAGARAAYEKVLAHWGTAKPRSITADRVRARLGALPKNAMQLAAGMMVTTSVRLIRPLGAGGMGSVWVAEHLSLRTEVVVKFMSAELAASEQAAARFAREAASAAQAKSPHVVQMHDHGITPDGVPYIVMERLEGRDLGRHLEEVGPLLPAAFATILDQIAKALRRAHERGIVHRDIKPDNVFLCDTDGGETFVKLLDFGIAKSADGLQGNSTSTGAVVGTPYYMSPEQVIDAKTIDFRSDLWSVGVLAFKALTGKLPFFADSFGALALAIHHGPIPKPSTQNPALPAAVDAWFLRACARDPEDRFASAREMADAFATSTGGLARSESTPPPKRARRKVPWRLIAGAGVVCVVVAAVATTYRAARRPRIRYCAFVEESVDGPRCALEVGAALIDKRFETYRITDVGGKVTRVEAVSFAGPFVRFWWDRARGLTRDIVRGDDGAVRHILVRDHDGNVEQVEKWSEGGKRIDLVDDDGTPGGAVRMGRHRTTPRFGDPRSSDSDESLYTIRREFDAQGRITSERHFAAAGRPTTDAAGAYGYAYAFGRTAGIAVRKTVLGADGKPAADAHGASVTETADDGTPGGGDIRYFDIEGKPTAVDGVHHEHRNWNASQEQTDSVAFGLHDQKVVNLESGVCEERRDWDRAKRTLSVTWLDELGRQRPLKNETLSAVRRTYDERGREVLVDHLDAHGNRVYDRKEGAGAHRFTWDDRDHWVEVEFLDVAGALAKGRYGFARQVMKYDAHGLFIEQRLFDETGKLTSWRDGAPIRTVTRDERGRQIASDWFDADEHAVANIHGWAGWRGRYDRLGNPVELAFVGPDGHSSIGDEGYAIERRTYDDNGDLLTEAFLDASGAPTMHNGEYATQRVTRDDLGLIAQEEYLDGHGERILRKEGYATVRFVRDRNGDVVEAAYFGKHDEPITREGGFAKKKTAYDLRRHLVETALQGASGALTEGADRWAIERNFYDDRGLVVRREYLDADRKPKLAKSGSASNNTVYDARGNLIEEASQGVDGQPIAAAVGYATKRSAYDERDQLTSESLFGADGGPVAGKAMWSVRRLRYDELGNLVEEAFFDSDHRPIAPKDASYASVLSRFDARQRLIETAYYDGGGAPAKGPEGVAAVRYKRDAYGRATETAFVDGSGAPALSNDAKVVVRTRYDDAGRVIEELFTDGAGAAHLAKDGCAGRRTKYDRLGRKVEESCVGVNDGVAISIEGWASRRTLHDARGNAVDQSTYGADGVLRADKTGVARRKTRFDERNLAIETAFFGADEKPAKDRRGVQVVRFTYDDSGKQTKETSLDERGGVVVVPSAKAVAEAKK